MRFNEFKTPTLKAYRIVVVLSDNSSAETLIYSDTPENAWLIASKQYGSSNIVSVNDPRRPKANKPTDNPSALQFWAERFRKFAGLATPTPQPRSFADQAAANQRSHDDRILSGVKAKKARREFYKTLTSQ